MKRYRAGIVGATGYTGIELLRIIDQHPALDLSLVVGSSWAGKPLLAAWPGIQGLIGDRVVESLEADTIIQRCDVVFLALPHGVSAGIVPTLVSAGVQVIDLGADFRLKDAEIYERFYGMHPASEWLETAVYGLTEWNRAQLPGA